MYLVKLFEGELEVAVAGRVCFLVVQGCHFVLELFEFLLRAFDFEESTFACLFAKEIDGGGDEPLVPTRLVLLLEPVEKEQNLVVAQQVFVGKTPSEGV